MLYWVSATSAPIQVSKLAEVELELTSARLPRHERLLRT
jgi:hypothetical protein